MIHWGALMSVGIIQSASVVNKNCRGEVAVDTKQIKQRRKGELWWFNNLGLVSGSCKIVAGAGMGTAWASERW